MNFDSFFINIKSSGSGLLTSSFLGGSKDDAGASIAVDSAWNSYVTGNTSSSDFPVTANAYQKTLKGVQAVFLTKIIIEGDLSLTASPSPNPVAHGANLTYTYDLPFRGSGWTGRAIQGWRMNGIIRSQAGIPFGASTAFNPGDGLVTGGIAGGRHAARLQKAVKG